MVRKACAIAAALCVAGCNDLPQARTETEIRRIAAEEASRESQRLTSRIANLEQQLQEQHRDIGIVRDLAISTSEAHTGLVKTFNGNVDKNNNAKVAAMTASGACGSETIQYPGGGIVVRHKECTLKDLRP